MKEQKHKELIYERIILDGMVEIEKWTIKTPWYENVWYSFSDAIGTFL